ncbi:hypothetical protein C4J81_19160 (plasmid) [Deltaproteobacteria bacterium Smac51]|nr:hypothetical protein C4J81_19160 [Deltaproteobacteria bacterium Smac51]
MAFSLPPKERDCNSGNWRHDVSYNELTPEVDDQWRLEYHNRAWSFNWGRQVSLEPEARPGAHWTTRGSKTAPSDG